MDDMVRASPFIGSRGSPFHSKRELLESPFLGSHANQYYTGGRQAAGVYSDTRFSPYIDPLRSPNLPQGSPQFMQQRYNKHRPKKSQMTNYKKQLRRIDPRLMPSRNHDLSQIKKNFHGHKGNPNNTHSVEESDGSSSRHSKNFSDASKGNRKTEDTEKKNQRQGIEQIKEEQTE